MKCYYCQNECQIGTPLPSFPGDVWICYYHPPKIVEHYVSKTYHKDGDCQSDKYCPNIRIQTNIIFSSKTDKYTVTLIYDTNEHVPIKDWKGRMILSEGSPNRFKFKTIMELYDVPVIHPEELDRKVPTWITFS